MDPLTDFDRALREAMRVEPGGDFTARIRARVATAPRQSLVPRFAIAAMTCALLAVVAAGVWRDTTPFVADSVLPHRDLMVLSEPPRVVSWTPSHLPLQSSRTSSGRTDVMVSRSEMLALQRLFAGIAVAPAPNPVADELVIPELTIEPIAPFPVGPEGERQ